MPFDLINENFFARTAKCVHVVATFRALAVIIFLLTAGLFSQSPAATLPMGFTETSVTGLSAPTAMAVHPDGRIFVCQQGGALRVIRNGVLLATPFVTVTTDSNGERGLLGIAFDPNYAANHYVYVYYTATTPATHNRISRFTADITNNEDTAVPGSEFVLMDLDDLSSATNHNGGVIHFGTDGKLYVGVGENANSSNAQSLANRLGKILRINSDGSIPADNPTTFPNVSGTPTGLNKAIYAIGMRNPFTFAVQQGTGRIFINDVGQVTWEEVDDLMPGLNYGWPTCEGIYLQGTSTPCNTPGLTDSIYTYNSATAAECAITGGDFYSAATPTFPAPYAGKYYFADYCGGWIKYFDPLSPPGVGGATGFATGINSPVDIHVGNDGSLYYLARGSGAVFRVQYFGITPTPTNTPSNTPTATFTATNTNTPTPTPTASPANSISGTVTYVNASSTPRYVSNVLISGQGSPNVSTTTAPPGPDAGTYTLAGFGGGAYTVTPSKVGGANGISSFDAARVAQHVVGIPPLLNANQLIAADTSGNGQVSSFDAAQIAQYVVSGVGGHAGEWTFRPMNRMYSSVTGNITGEDYNAILIGEVSGNWTNTGARVAVGGGPEKSTSVEAPLLTAKPGDQIIVPLKIQRIANKGIISYEFDLRYDPAVVQPGPNVVDLTETVSRGLSAVVNSAEPGLLRVAVFGPMPISSSGVLLNLRFTAVGSSGTVSPLKWERIMLNEGGPAITTTDGQIELF